MKNIKEINQTIDTFLSIIDYCKNNNLVFWSEHKGYHYRMYVGGRSFFETQAKNSDYGAFEITPAFIKEEKLNLKFIPAEQNKTCSLQLWNSWAMQDTQNHGYHLFFHCINSTQSHEIYKPLFDSFFPKNQQFKIGHFLNYGNIISNGKFDLDKWNKILKILTTEELEVFWNKKDEVDLVSSLLKKVKNKNDVESFIESILNKHTIESSEFNDKSLNFSNLILENFSQSDKLNHYCEKYSFIKQLTNNKGIFDSFLNENLIEKSLINNFDISYSYPIDGKDIKSYTKMVCSIAKEISDNSQIKDIGLIEIDAVEKDNNTCFYLNLVKNSIFHKNHFETILKNVIDFFHEKNSSEDIKKTVDSFVQKWYLDYKFPDKLNGTRKNKL